MCVAITFGAFGARQHTFTKSFTNKYHTNAYKSIPKHIKAHKSIYKHMKAHEKYEKYEKSEMAEWERESHNSKMGMNLAERN